MQIADKLQTFTDGQGVIEHFEKILRELPEIKDGNPVQPVSLLLLDINMPVKDGFQTLKEVK